MAWLKYYADERARHPGLHVAPIMFEEARDVIARLSKEHEIEIAKVERTSGSRRSMFYPWSKRIRLNCDHLNWLTVIHEFAHALDNAARRDRKRWHTAAHAEMVDMLARKVVDAGWLSGLAAERAAKVQRDLARIDKRQARAALAQDPAVVRAKRIEKRRAQVARLTTRLKTLTTRLRTARRSLAALERAAARKGDKP